MDCIGQLILTEQTCNDSIAWARDILPMTIDGTVLIARNLTQARGRQGRRWILAQGQITHTVILKPFDDRRSKPFETQLKAAPQGERGLSKTEVEQIKELPISAHPEEDQRSVSKDMSGFSCTEQSLAALNMAFTLGLWSLLHKHGATIKWPNDLYLNNKKLGGMLFENLWHGDALTSIVVAYSLNINNNCIGHEILEPIATSLADATGKQFDLGLMQTELFASLSQFYASWKRGEYLEIFRLWRSAQGYLGKSIKVHNKDGSLLEGIAQDVLPNGDLVLAVATSDRTVVVTFSQVVEVSI